MAKREWRRQQLVDALDSGLQSVQEIAAQMEVSELYVRTLAWATGVRIPGTRHTTHIAKDVFLAAYHASSFVQDLAEHFGKRSGRIPHMVAHAYGIPYPGHLRPWRQRPALDALIDAGEHSLTDMAARVGLTLERVRQYVEYNGFAPVFAENRRLHQFSSREAQEEAQQHDTTLHSARTCVLHALMEYRARLRIADDWPSGMAAQWVEGGTDRTGQYDAMHTVFSRYAAGVTAGVIPSVRILAQDTPFPEHVVYAALRSAGLPRSRPSGQASVRPKWRRAAFMRVPETAFSAADAAYFLHSTPRSVNVRLQQSGLHHPKVPQWHVGTPRVRVPLHRTASVYEAEDAGFHPEEIAVLSDLAVPVVREILSARDVLAPVLLQNLRILYADNSISVPWYRRPLHA